MPENHPGHLGHVLRDTRLNLTKPPEMSKITVFTEKYLYTKDMACKSLRTKNLKLLKISQNVKITVFTKNTHIPKTWSMVLKDNFGKHSLNEAFSPLSHIQLNTRTSAYPFDPNDHTWITLPGHLSIPIDSNDHTWLT